MLTYHDTSELDISNQMKGLWELQDTKVGVFLQNMGCKIANLKRNESIWLDQQGFQPPADTVQSFCAKG